MTQKQAYEICRTALPFHIYKCIPEEQLIGVADSIMFYCACMIKKATDLDCDIEFKLNFKSKLFDLRKNTN